MSLFLQIRRREQVKARVATFILGAAFVAGMIEGSAAQRTIFLVLFIFLLLALATHYSPEAIHYRSWKKVDRLSKRKSK